MFCGRKTSLFFLALSECFSLICFFFLPFGFHYKDVPKCNHTMRGTQGFFGKECIDHTTSFVRIVTGLKKATEVTEGHFLKPPSLQAFVAYRWATCGVHALGHPTVKLKKFVGKFQFRLFFCWIIIIIFGEVICKINIWRNLYNFVNFEVIFFIKKNHFFLWDLK